MKLPQINRDYFRHTLPGDLAMDILGGILMALGIYTFAVGGNFVPGGVSGLALIIYHFTNFPIGTSTLLINIPIVLVSYRIMGNGFLFRSAKSMVITSFMIDTIFPLFPVYQGDPLLAAVFTGLCNGMGLSLIYNRGSSTGGSDFLILSVHKKIPYVSVGTMTMCIDGSIIVLGGLLFGRVDAFLHGLIATVIATLVIDRMMLGAVSGKMLFVISSSGPEIAKEINSATGRGATMLEGIGTYTGRQRQVVLCVCSKREVPRMRRISYAVDPRAIVTVSAYEEAFGEGFQKPGA